MALTLGAKGIDFAYNPTGHADLDTQYAQIAHDGAHFVCRYSDGEVGAGKETRVGEIQAAVKHGIDFFANFEGAGNTPLLGAAEGTRRGVKDKDFWAKRGLAAGAGVIVSLEPGHSSSDWPALSAFLTAYHSAVGRPLGLYAGLKTLIEMRRRGLIICTWLPMASSVSDIDTSGLSQAQYAAKLQKVAHDNGINLCQNRNRWYSDRADEDIYVTALTHPFSHLQATAAAHPAPTPTPTPKPAPSKEIDMFVQYPTDTSNGDISKEAVYVFSGGVLTWLTPEEYHAAGSPKPTPLDHTTSHIYKAHIAAGTPDPRVPGTK